MKKRILITTIFLAGALVFCLGMDVLDTVRIEYRVMRAEADENATTLDLTTKGNYANIPSGRLVIDTRNDGGGSGVNMMEAVFCGGAAADKTFTYKIYAWRAKNGIARMVATGAGTLGTQAVVIYPQGGAATNKFWADTLTVSRSNWLKSVSSSDDSGNNEVASIQFDSCGYKYFYFEITNADGVTGSEAGDITVYYSFF